jgi:hypothetical protein
MSFKFSQNHREIMFRVTLLLFLFLVHHLIEVKTVNVELRPKSNAPLIENNIYEGKTSRISRQISGKYCDL